MPTHFKNSEGWIQGWIILIQLRKEYAEWTPFLESSKTDSERKWTAEVNPCSFLPRNSNDHLAKDLSFLKLTTHTLQSSLWWNTLRNLIFQTALLFTWCSTRSQRAHEKLNREHKIWMEWSLAHKSSAVLERCFIHSECLDFRNRVSASLSKEDATIFKPL